MLAETQVLGQTSSSIFKLRGQGYRSRDAFKGTAFPCMPGLAPPAVAEQAAAREDALRAAVRGPLVLILARVEARQPRAPALPDSLAAWPQAALEQVWAEGGLRGAGCESRAGGYAQRAHPRKLEGLRLYAQVAGRPARFAGPRLRAVGRAATAACCIGGACPWPARLLMRWTLLQAAAAAQSGGVGLDVPGGQPAQLAGALVAGLLLALASSARRAGCSCSGSSLCCAARREVMEDAVQQHRLLAGVGAARAWRSMQPVSPWHV